MKKKVTIVGAGIAGLSAGCYAQINGYDTEILEMHSIPGGLCTSWTRKGYVFDGCIHFLIGTRPGSRLHDMWNEVGAFDGTDIVNRDVYMQVEGTSGKKLVLYCDVDRLEEHLLELSPADAGPVRELTGAIRNFSLAGSAPPGFTGSRLRQMSMKEFLREIEDPFLREALSTFDSMGFFLMAMSSYGRKDAGWPVGGSLEFARRIEKRFISLGGRVTYAAKVDEILVEHGRAIGVRLLDGTVHASDYVISAADGHATLFHLLRGRHLSPGIASLYAHAKTYPTSIQVSLGVDCDLSDQPHSLFLRLSSPVNVAGVRKEGLLIENHCYDKTLSPRGKSVVTGIIQSSYEYWEGIHQDPEAYAAEKEKAASIFVNVFEDRFPQARGKVEVVDVATPITYNRYTGAWRGAYMGWMSTPEAPVTDISSTLPGLQAFYMTGQWTYPRGGLPTALLTARGSIMGLCRDEGREFVTKTV